MASQGCSSALRLEKWSSRQNIISIQAGDVEAALFLQSPSVPSLVSPQPPSSNEESKTPPFGQKLASSQEEERLEPRVSLVDIQTKILNYYRGSFFAGPTAGVVYELLQQLKLETKQAMWGGRPK